MKKYPDVSELFSRKAEARRKLGRLSVEQRMEIARRLTEAGKYAPGYRKRIERSPEFVKSLKALTSKKVTGSR